MLYGRARVTGQGDHPDAVEDIIAFTDDRLTVGDMYERPVFKITGICSPADRRRFDI